MARVAGTSARSRRDAAERFRIRAGWHTGHVRTRAILFMECAAREPRCALALPLLYTTVSGAAAPQSCHLRASFRDARCCPRGAAHAAAATLITAECCDVYSSIYTGIVASAHGCRRRSLSVAVTARADECEPQPGARQTQTTVCRQTGIDSRRPTATGRRGPLTCARADAARITRPDLDIRAAGMITLIAGTAASA